MYESCPQSCCEEGSYSLWSFNCTSIYHMKPKKSSVGIFQLLLEDILIVILFLCSKLEILVPRSGHCNLFLSPTWTKAWGGMQIERNQIPETYSRYGYTLEFNIWDALSSIDLEGGIRCCLHDGTPVNKFKDWWYSLGDTFVFEDFFEEIQNYFWLRWGFTVSKHSLL